MGEEIYDVVIVGGGPAGLAGGLYAARDGLKGLLLERLGLGGQIATTDIVENYPAVKRATGPELSARMEEQCRAFGLQVRYEEVNSIEGAGPVKTVRSAAAAFRTRTVLVAAGSDYRKLGVPGEKELTGRGVSYCATCDGPFFREKSVFVVGGGDAAIDESLFLTRFVKGVTVIHRRDQLRASPYLQKKAFDNPKIDFLWDSVVEEILGSNRVERLKVRNKKTEETRETPCEGVFIFIGSTPNSSLLRGVVEMDEKEYVRVDLGMRTSVPGVYAAGDVRVGSVRQMASSVGDGVTAIMEIKKYLQEED